MIHICTVHFETQRWIAPQRRFLDRYLDSPYRVLACVPAGVPAGAFDVQSTFEPGSIASLNHAEKLQYLAECVLADAADDDLILFLDGDAFPIAPLDEFLHRTLSQHPFIAVQRVESDGDPQPHPSFAACRVGFWRALGADWHPGYRWCDNFGQLVTDTGANLMLRLQEAQVDWHRMRRSNAADLHGLWFGIYDDVVYHHGAGFREPASRYDENRTARPGTFTSTPQFEANRRLSEQVYERLAASDGFLRELGLSRA